MAILANGGAKVAANENSDSESDQGEGDIHLGSRTIYSEQHRTVKICQDSDSNRFEMIRAIYIDTVENNGE